MDKRIISALREARHIVVLTGAGVSAESGVPTFRDKQTGLWEHFDAAELATAAAFQRDPALVWGWYEWRRGTVMRAQPNSGHRAIATLAARVSQLTLVTQNVDDLHERAGSSPVLHLHGDISRPFCEACRQPHTLATGFPDVAPEGSRIEPPRCMCCGGRVRPGVVWFGESLPQAPWQTALEATRQCDAFICVGTSALVYPAASLALLAIERSVTTLQINPNVTELDAFVTEAIHGTSGEVLPRLVEEVWAASDSAPTFNQ